MGEIDFISIAIRIIITWACYMLIPLILKNLLHKNYNEKQALKLSIINSIVVGLLFFVVESFITKNQKINILPAFFWGFINYNVLKPSKKSLYKDKKNEKKNLQDFIADNIEDQDQYSSPTMFNVNNEEVIKELMKKSSLPKVVCQHILNVLMQFQLNKKEIAYNIIEEQLIPDLKKYCSSFQVGVAFGMLIEDFALTEDEANGYSTMVISQMIGTEPQKKDENYNSSKVFCKHCGKKHDTEAKYCEYCGKKI